MSHLRLAVLDVDGTLKQAESPYQYLHGCLGVEQLAEPNRILARAGRISYAEWLRRDALLWAGQPVTHIQGLLARNPFLAGAPELLRALKRSGVAVALVSAGFTLNTDPILAEFGLDYVLANELTSVGGVLDGGAVNHVPERGKADFACGLMERLGIPPEETLAAGDTAGDIELFECAGVRIAVNPTSERLRAIADVTFEPDLSGAVAWLVARGHLPAERATALGGELGAV